MAFFTAKFGLLFSFSKPAFSFISTFVTFNYKELRFMTVNGMLPPIHSCDSSIVFLSLASSKPQPYAQLLSVSNLNKISLCVLFWNSKTDELPQLSKLAQKYIYALVNSADAERSFSLYNLVFSDRRRSLSEDNLKALVFMFYNNFIDSIMFRNLFLAIYTSLKGNFQRHSRDF